MLSFRVLLMTLATQTHMHRIAVQKAPGAGLFFAQEAIRFLLLLLLLWRRLVPALL